MSGTNNSRDFLTEAQQTILQTFQEITQITDDQLCMQILQQNSWNIDLSVNQYVQDQSGSSGAIASSSSGGSQPRNRNASPHRNGATNATTISQDENSRSGVLDLAFLPLRWLFQSRPVSMNPTLDTTKFIDQFERTYGNNHPVFQNCSYQTAVANAFQQSKFLLVYLDSPIHEDTSKFCREVLCAPSVVNITNQNLLVWIGKIWDPEAYGLSTQLKASSFPFVALLVCQSNRVVQVADRIQGLTSEAEFVGRIQGAVTTFNNVIVRNREETNRREESTRLREQQDREYRESQEADRLENLRRQEELRRKEEEEEESRQREELQRAVELSEKLTREDKLRKLRAYFEQHLEPEATAEVATVRFQLPQGKKLSRRFQKTDESQVIIDYLTLHFAETAGDGTPVTNFSVSMNYPKLELTDMGRTLESLGLHPRGMLYVQDLDA